MNPSGIRSQSFTSLFQRFRLQRGLLFGMLIVAALLAFEIFNYSTTDYALGDLLGDLRFIGIRWSTILAIAFCGIDFAGIARLFTPEEGADEPAEVWYLFGAWMLAATMNAMLTWWGVSLAILNHQTLGNAVIERQTLLRVVPIFVAVMVWLIRVLIIGTFSIAGDRLFTQSTRRVSTSQVNSANARPVGVHTYGSSRPSATPVSAASPSFRSNRGSRAQQTGALEPGYSRSQEQGYTRPEPTYHPVSQPTSMSPGDNGNSTQTRR